MEHNLKNILYYGQINVTLIKIIIIIPQYISTDLIIFYKFYEYILFMTILKKMSHISRDIELSCKKNQGITKSFIRDE